MYRANSLRAQATALALGLRDGWQQPHEIGWSWNVEHLADASPDVFEIQDLGINLGQFARAQFESEAWTQGFPPFDRVPWRKS